MGRFDNFEYEKEIPVIRYRPLSTPIVARVAGVAALRGTVTWASRSSPDHRLVTAR